MKTENLLNDLSKLTVLDVIALTKKLETTWGVSSAPKVSVNLAPANIVAVEEQTSFLVLLKSFGANKISVIKEVREITKLGLAEAKALVEKAPTVVLDGIPKDQADNVKERLTKIGADIEIR